MTLVVLSGPSAVGKDLVVRSIAESWRAKTVTPFTTRPPRVGEADGVDYHFVSVAFFQSLITSQRLCVWDYLFGHYYGYDLSLAQEASDPASTVVIHCLARMALRLREKIGECLLVYLGSADFDLLDRRLAERSISRDEFQARVKHRDEEATHSVMFDLIIADAGSLEVDDVIQRVSDALASR